MQAPTPGYNKWVKFKINILKSPLVFLLIAYVITLKHVTNSPKAYLDNMCTTWLVLIKGVKMISQWRACI